MPTSGGGGVAKSLKLRIGVKQGRGIVYRGRTYAGTELHFSSLDDASRAARALQRIISVVLESAEKQEAGNRPATDVSGPTSPQPLPESRKAKPSATVAVVVSNVGKGDADLKVTIGDRAFEVTVPDGEKKKIAEIDRVAVVEIEVEGLRYGDKGDAISDALRVRVPSGAGRVVLTVSRRVTATRRILGKAIHRYAKPEVRAGTE
jgi:hypothetical protein